MDEIITTHRSKVRAIIRKITGTYNEDLEQDVFIKAWENKDKYQEQNKYSAWIGAIAVNLCRDYFKQKHVKAGKTHVSESNLDAIADKSDSSDMVYETKVRQKLILKAVNSLPYKLKQVIILFEFEELSYSEIAQKLSIAEGTVKSRLFNARSILSEKLNYLQEK